MPRENKLLKSIDEKLIESVFDKFGPELEKISWREKNSVWKEIMSLFHVNNTEKSRKSIYTLWRNRKKKAVQKSAEDMQELQPEHVQESVQDESPNLLEENGKNIDITNKNESINLELEEHFPDSQFGVLTESTKMYTPSKFIVETSSTEKELNNYESINLELEEHFPDSLFGVLKESTNMYTPSKLIGETSSTSKSEIEKPEKNTEELGIDDLLLTSPELEKYDFAPDSQFGELNTSPEINLTSNFFKYESEKDSTKDPSIISGSLNDLEEGNLLSGKSSNTTSTKKHQSDLEKSFDEEKKSVLFTGIHKEIIDVIHDDQNQSSHDNFSSGGNNNCSHISTVHSSQSNETDKDNQGKSKDEGKSFSGTDSSISPKQQSRSKKLDTSNSVEDKSGDITLGGNESSPSISPVQKIQRNCAGEKYNDTLVSSDNGNFPSGSNESNSSHFAKQPFKSTKINQSDSMEEKSGENCVPPGNGFTDSNHSSDQNKGSSIGAEDQLRDVPNTGIPSKFKFKISPCEWANIKPSNGNSKLRYGWSDLLAKKLREKNSYCVINFYYHHLRKPGGRKKNVPFLTAKAKCKFKGCSTYDFIIKRQPPQTPQKDIKVRVKRLGNISHERKLVHKRHTRKPERKKIAKELEAESISRWYYKAFAKIDDEARMGGNVSQPKTQAVLRKIKSEQLLEANVHLDMLQEVKILNDVYRDIEEGGFIRFLAVQPFQVHFYLEEQLSEYIKINKKHNAVLYFDATGSIIQKIPGQPQRIFLYSLVMKNPIEGKSVLPLAEFLSNDHHSSEIRHFLGFLLNHLKRLTMKVIPRQIETDLSWAMIQAVLQAFNEHNAREYLEFVWNLVSKKFGIKDIKSKTFIHICSAHVLQIFIRTLELKSCSKPLKDLIMRSLCCLLNSTSLQEGQHIFCLMCDVLIPSTFTEQVREGMKELTALIKKTDMEEDLSEIEESVLESIEIDESTEKEVSEKLLKRSKFYRFFQSVYVERLASSGGGEECDEENPYHSHSKLKIILDLWMGLFPLWSGLLLGDLRRYVEGSDHSAESAIETRSTNCYVENYFGILKTDIPKRQKLRPAEFIRRQYTNIKGKLSEIDTLKPSVVKGARKKDKEDQEQWRPKSDRGRKKSLYFTPPIIFPKSAKRKLAFDVQDSSSKKRRTECLDKDKPKEDKTPKMDIGIRQADVQVKSEDLQQRSSKIEQNKQPMKSQEKVLVSAPKWGGKGIFEGKSFTFQNTCPVDNLLFMLFTSLKERETVRRLLSEESPMQEPLKRIMMHMEKGDWFLARMEWVQSFCKEVVQREEIAENDVLINFYGSEYVMFIQALGCVQETKQTGICKEPNCSSKYLSMKNEPISLSLPEDGDPDDMQGMVNHYFSSYINNCGRKSADGSDCSGFRVWDRRRFANFDGKPPVLIFSPCFLVEDDRTGRKTQERIPTLVERLVIRNARYALTGVTFHDPNVDHFFANIKINGVWKKYDGLRVPLLTSAKSIEQTCKKAKVNSVFYVLES